MKTKLPFSELTEAAREADILPGLKRSLISVNKMSEEGYTTIFHPGEEGVTVHQKGTVSITTTAPPVLHGYKENGEKLWTINKYLKIYSSMYKLQTLESFTMPYVLHTA